MLPMTASFIVILILGVSSWKYTTPGLAWIVPTTTTTISSRNRFNKPVVVTKQPPTMYVDSVNIKIKDIPNTSPITYHNPNKRIPFLQQQRPSTSSNNVTITHEMPWKQSISMDYKEESLFYMPFWEWQISYMKQHLTNLHSIPVLSHSGRDMSYIQNINGTVRMHTCAFRCDEYKYIRCTVLDGGYQTQVFTSLWYPHEQSTQPVLGIDLLQFNRGKKHLCIVDFQPINMATKYDNTFEDVLRPIRDQYPSLQGVMTDRFYDPNDTYFSNQMLLGRHNQRDESYTAHDMVYKDLYPAYQQYVQTHVQLVQQEQRSKQISEQEAGDIQDMVTRCHSEYDTYSASHDPAHGLLARLFGQEWADEYVYDILFPSANRS